MGAKLKTAYCMSLAIFSLALTHCAYGFEIGPMAQSTDTPDFSDVDLGVARFEKNHEKLTALAILCLAEVNAGEGDMVNEPSVCARRDASPGRLKELFANMLADEKVPAQVKQYADLIEFVRWPDDPTRFVHNNKRSAGKFVALTKGGGCKALMARHGGKLTLVHDGLLCNSHYGKLQMLHAMAAGDDVDYVITRGKIDEWAKFAFRVASTGQLIDKGYCGFWKDNREYPALAKVMYEPDFERLGWCKYRPVSWFKKLFRYTDQNAWTVGTTFNLVCKNPVSSGTCNIYSIHDADREIRQSALGSLIHMVQDAYSRSHTDRAAGDDIYAEISCNEVVSFRSYTNQDETKHNVSDKWPYLDLNCKDSKILDPITAAAKIIWLVHNYRKATYSIADLMDQVLGSGSGVHPKSSRGERYKKALPDS